MLFVYRTPCRLYFSSPSSSTATTCASQRRNNSSSKHLEACPRVCCALASPRPTREAPITMPVAAQRTELPAHAPSPVEPVFMLEWGEGVGGDVRKGGKPQGTKQHTTPPSPEGHSREVHSHPSPGRLDSEGRVANLPLPILCTVLYSVYPAFCFQRIWLLPYPVRPPGWEGEGGAGEKVQRSPSSITGLVGGRAPKPQSVAAQGQ